MINYKLINNEFLINCIELNQIEGTELYIAKKKEQKLLELFRGQKWKLINEKLLKLFNS